MTDVVLAILYRNTFNTVFAFRVHLRESRSRKNVKGSSESQKLQENSDGTRSSSPVDTVTPLVVPLTTRTRFALVNRNELPVNFIISKPRRSKRLSLQHFNDLRNIPFFLLFSKIWHFFFTKKWREWERKRQKDSIPYTFESTKAFAFPSKNPRTRDPETQSILEYIWSVTRRNRFSRRFAFLRNWPGSISRIDASSRFSTHVARYAGIRGGPWIHRWDKSAHPSRSKYPFPLDIWRLHRHSWHAVPSTDPRSLSSRLSLVSDETGFAPNFTVELYNLRCRRCALYAFSLCYVFLRPTVSVFLFSSPSVSLARNLWRRATSTKNNWTIRKSRRSFWEKWSGTGA